MNESTREYHFRTQHGVPAYDAARWLAPPPIVRKAMNLPSGITLIVQIGATVAPDVTQEALVYDRRCDSLLLFPDGTNAFDLYRSSRREQPQAAVGVAKMGPSTPARWVARPNRDRMIQVHIPVGMRSRICGEAQVDFDGDFLAANDSLARLIALFSSEIENPDTTALLIETYVSLLLQKLSAVRTRNDGPAPRSARAARDWRIAQSIERIEAQLGETLSVVELATLSGLSVSQYGRLFRAATGTSPQAWITARRIERASALLNSGIPITEIALTLGFASSQHFATVFRNYMGISPSQFRRESGSAHRHGAT